MRLRGMLVLVLVLGAAVAARADAIKARLQFDGPGFGTLSKEAQLAAVNTVASQLQAALSKLFKISDFESGVSGNGLRVAVRGELAANGIPQSAAEDIRRAALEAAAAVPAAKFALSDFNIEVDDGARVEVEREIKLSRRNEEVAREKARSQPRLEVEVKDKLIENLTILEVPLVRAMDRLGAALPVAYVLHPETVGRPVFVRLINVTLDEALAAIAESAQVKIEKREKYIAFVGK